MILIPLVWAVHLHLGTGRLWLALLIFVFFTDAAIRSWRQGRRRRALAVGIGAGGFIMIGGVHAPLVDAGMLDMPYMVSFAFLTMVMAMTYELVVDAVQTSRLMRANMLGELASALAHELNQPLSRNSSRPASRRA